MDANVPEDKPDQQSPENGGDHIQVGDIKDGKAIAIGRGATAVYQGLSVEEVAALVVELKHRDQPTVWDGRTPYLGLTTFQESDAQFFFGREGLVDDLLVRVQQQAKFIVIAGPSGSGKSSVARAGLLHALREGRLERSDTWLLTAMQPKGDPIEQLAITIDRMVGAPGAGDYLREQAIENSLALNRQIETLLSDDARQRCVLVVDQFEEIFTQTKDKTTQAAFINLITAAAQAEAGRTLIVLSLRSDFVSHCARYPDLRRLMSRQFQLVGAMAPQDLAKAITLPALEVGAEIDPALVSRIMADMKGEPGVLPLMSFALQDLFEAEKTKKGQPMDLTLEEYLQRGGIESALERHANKVFESFSDEQKALARGIFARLIEVGEGRVDTRRTATFLELVPAGASRELVVKTIAKLAEEDARLLTTSGVVREEQIFDERVATAATVTIAHEKLIDAWPWLRKLVDENRESIKLQNNIAEAARAWETHDRDNSYLYTGARLEDMEEKLADGRLQLTESSNDFVAASILRRKVAARNRQFVVFGLAALTILAIIAALFAFRFAGQASDNAADAQANQATAEAEKQRAEAQTTRAMIAEHEAVAARGTAEAEATRADVNFVTAESALATSESALATSDARLVAEIQNRSRELELQAAIVDDGTEKLLLYLRAINVAATNSFSHTISAERRLYHHLTTFRLRRTLTGHQEMIRRVSFNPDGRRIVAIGLNRVWLWDMQGNFHSSYETDSLLSGDSYGFDLDHSPTLAVECTSEGFGDCADQVWFWDDDGNLITYLSRAKTEDQAPVGFDLDPPASESQFICSLDDFDSFCLASTIEIRDAEGQLISSIENDPAVTAFAVSPDGQYLVTVSGERLQLWFIGEENAVELQGDTSSVRSADVNSNGNFVVTVDRDGVAQLWSGYGNFLSEVGNKDQHVSSVAFSPDGTTILTTDDDDVARLWDLDNRLVAEFKGHDGAISWAEFHPDGTLVVTASRDGTIRIWDVAGNPVQVLEDWHKVAVISARFSRDGAYLVTTDIEENVGLWKDNGELTFITNFVDEGAPVGTDALINADGSAILTGYGFDGGLLWDNQGDLIGYLEAPLNVSDVNFSPDGRTVVMAGCGSLQVDAGYICSAGSVLFWNTNDGMLEHEFSPFPGHVYAAKLNPASNHLLTFGCPYSHYGDPEAYGEYCDRPILRLWDIDLPSHTQALLVELELHIGDIEFAHFNVTGTRIISKDSEGNVLLLETYPDLETMLLDARGRVFPLLAEEECNLYFDEEACSDTLPD